MDDDKTPKQPWADDWYEASGWVEEASASGGGSTIDPAAILKNADALIAQARSDKTDAQANPALWALVVEARAAVGTSLSTRLSDPVLRGVARLEGLRHALDVARQDAERRVEMQRLDDEARAGREALAAVLDPADLASDLVQKKRLDDVRALIAARLQAPLQAQAVSAACAEVAGFKLLVAEVDKELKAAAERKRLDEEARVGREALAAVLDPADLAIDPVQKQRLDDARALIAARLQAPLQAQAVSAACAEVAGFKLLVAEVDEELKAAAERKRLEEEARVGREALAAVLDPADLASDPALTKRLDDARALIAARLQAPLQAQAVSAACGEVPAFAELVKTVTADLKVAADRKALLATFYKLRNPAGALPTEVAEIDKKRQLVLDALPVPTLAKDLVAAEKCHAELLVAVKELVTTVAARQAWQARLAAVSNELNAALTQLGQEPADFLANLRTVAVAAAKVATKAAEFKAAQDQLDALQAELAPAVAYGALLDAVELKEPVYTANAVNPAALRQLIADAKPLAKVGKFVEATAKLNAFLNSADPNVKKAVDYHKALDELRASPAGRDLASLNKDTAIPAHGQLLVQLTAAKGPALTGPIDHALAEAQVRAFKLRLQAMVAYAASLRAIEALLVVANPGKLDAPATLVLQTALNSAKLKATAVAPVADYADAKLLIDQALAAPTMVHRARYLAVLKKVKPRYDDLQAKAAAKPHGLHLKGLFDTALAKAALVVPDFDAAATELEALQTVLTEATAYQEQWMSAADLCKGLAPLVAAQLLAPAEGQAAAKKYKEAVDTLKGIAAAHAAALAYGARLAEASALNNALADPLHKAELKDVLDRARALTDPGGDHAGALAVLDELQQRPTLKKADAAMSAWLKRVAEVGAQHTRVHKGLAPFPAARAELSTRFDAAKNLAEVQNKHQDGVDALNLLAPILVQAERYAGLCAAAQALMTAVLAKCPQVGPNLEARWTTKKGVKNTAGAAPGTVVSPPVVNGANTSTTTVTTTVGKIITKVDHVHRRPKAAVDAKLLEARTIDAQLKFAEGIVKCNELRALARELGQGAAGSYEAADQGHSVSAHGPDVSQAEQIARIQTGMRADGDMCPAQATTTFDDIADWVATREQASEKTVEAMHALVPGWNMNRTNWNPGEPSSVMVVIEHGRPIDKCVVGLKEKQKLKQAGDNQGEAGGDGTYETYKTLSGLTRTRSNFVFKPGPGQQANFNNGLACTGAWKLHQQFPYADDWDDEAQCYTEPVPAVKTVVK